MKFFRYELKRCYIRSPHEIVLDLWDNENSFGFEIKKVCRNPSYIRDVIMNLNSNTFDIKAWEDILYTLTRELGE